MRIKHDIQVKVTAKKYFRGIYNISWRLNRNMNLISITRWVKKGFEEARKRKSKVWWRIEKVPFESVGSRLVSFKQDIGKTLIRRHVNEMEISILDIFGNRVCQRASLQIANFRTSLCMDLGFLFWEYLCGGGLSTKIFERFPKQPRGDYWGLLDFWI